MADQLDDDRDEEWFKEVYGTEYTGPTKGARDTRKVEPPPAKPTNKRTTTNPSDSEEDDEPRDPNAVPTDFTSREAKVWEAKAKAVERNWKRRKEEELTCRLCGEVGHFAQGCPTTLGGNRKSGEVVERISLRDKRLKPRIIGTGGAIIQGLEKETSCRLKLEDNLTVGNGAFFVKITGPDRMTVNKAVNAVTKLVDQVEDEWKQQSQPVVRKPQGGERERGDRGGGGGGGYRGGGTPVVNPLLAAQLQHISVQRLQHENPNSGGPGRRGEVTPPLDEEKRTIEHIASQLEARRQWEAVSGSSQQTLNGTYKEGRPASGVGSMSATLPGKLDGGSAFYPDSSVPYPSQAEQELEMDLEYDEHSLDELERRFLEETIELTKNQNKEEDKENARHRERLREIQEQFQQKMTQLRAKQARQREEFLRHEAHMRYQTPAVPAPPLSYSHYQYGGPGLPVPPPPPPLSASVYSDPLSSRPVSAYNDPLPPYESTYEKVYDPGSTDPLQGIRSTLYDTYSSEGPYSTGPFPPYNRKPGYDKPGYDTSVYNKTQVYDTKPYTYGSSPPYPAYG